MPQHRFPPAWRRRPRWSRRQLLWRGGILAAVAFLVIVIGGYLFGWKWTGLPNQTFWDWLDLLIVPIVLAMGGYLFTRSENRATRIAAEQRSQDEALQAYLDQMGQMLLDKVGPLRQSKEGEEVRILARARTLTVLGRLDGDRKGSALQFLYESGLISKDSGTVDLRGADLNELDLLEADLSGADLREAFLPRADLKGADLSEANLYNAYLGKAVLSGAVLSGAVLVGTGLGGANLSRANLSDSVGLTDEKIGAAASLDHATMPNGQEYEDWLKDKEGRKKEDEETGDSS